MNNIEILDQTFNKDKDLVDAFNQYNVSEGKPITEYIYTSQNLNNIFFDNSLTNNRIETIINSMNWDYNNHNEYYAIDTNRNEFVLIDNIKRHIANYYDEFVQLYENTN